VLRTQGIDAIVNLCAECLDLCDSEKNAGFDVHFLPVPDEGAPDMESLEKAFFKKWEAMLDFFK
jgi:hypothetical protein